MQSTGYGMSWFGNTWDIQQYIACIDVQSTANKLEKDDQIVVCLFSTYDIQTTKQTNKVLEISKNVYLKQPAILDWQI